MEPEGLMMKELKPCPFCGGEAKEGTTGIEGYNLYYFLYCTECFTQTTVYAGRSQAIAAWNRRS